MRFLMDFIMPPLKITKRISEESQNNNYVMSPPASNERVHYNCDDYAPKILNNLNALRLNSRFCDVEIIAGGKIVKAHRSILAASSPYFHAMFTGDLCEKHQTSVELHAISPSTLNILIEFIYTGEVIIDQNNVQDLIIAADMLELSEVVSGCSEYLINELHPSNAIGICRFAETHNCQELKVAAMQFILSRFPEICGEEEIYELPKEQIMKFLSSEYIRVETEFQVFQAAVRWITHDIVDRKRFVFEILKHVRLPLLSSGVLERAITECGDSSLKIALKSIHNDLVTKRGCLVPLNVVPRLSSKKHIFVIGGTKREFHSIFHRVTENNLVSISMEKYDPFTQEWSDAPYMNVSRAVPGVASLNGRIYVVGGEQDSSSLSCGEYYDPHENNWTVIADMVIRRCEFGLCSLNGYLYALGGWVGGDIGGSIERYNPKLNEWELIGNMPEARFSMGVVSFGGLIYMVGGCSESQRYLHDLLSYNPETGEWNTLQPLSIARSQMGVAILDDHLYVVGGINKHKILNSVVRYSFKKNKWTTVPSMKVGRSGPAVAAADGLLFVIGGDQTQENPFYRALFTLSSVECYNPITNSWSDCPPLPESRAEAGAVVL